MMRFFVSLIAVTLSSAGALAAADAPVANAPSPVLVELFTSEGCSSCPPADLLLQQIDRSQPVAGAQAIVLSEHVDYWNHLGWSDPYSSSFFSDRQNSYASHFGLASVYTPQMVIDGTEQFVAGDPRATDRAIEQARQRVKVPITISAVSLENDGTLRAHVEAGALPASGSHRRADIFVVAALDHAESQVARGENQGRHLTHVAVVLSLTKVGSTEKGKGFAGDARIKLDTRRDLSHLRAIAFVQEPGPGAVLGAAEQQFSK